MKTLIITIIALMFITPVYAIRTFTNEDIEKYQGEEITSEEIPAPPAPIIKNESQQSNDDKEQAKKDYWCNRATQARNRQARAAKALTDALVTEASISAQYGDRYSGAQAVTNATIERNRAADEARAAKDDLEQIEEEARKKGIYPGWLRCQ
jgi:hypothetical protein